MWTFMVYLTNILLFSGPALTLLMRSGYIVMGLSFFMLTLVLLLKKEILQYMTSYHFYNTNI